MPRNVHVIRDRRRARRDRFEREIVVTFAVRPHAGERFEAPRMIDRLHARALRELHAGAERLNRVRGSGLDARPRDAALVDEEFELERSGRGAQRSEEAVLVGRYVLIVAQEARLRRKEIGEVVDARVAHVRAEARRQRSGALCDVERLLPERAIERVVGAPFVLMVGGREERTVDRRRAALVTAAQMRRVAVAGRDAVDRRAVGGRQVEVGEARGDRRDRTPEIRSERRLEFDVVIRRVVRAEPESRAAARDGARADARSERFDVEYAADGRRTVECRSRSAQELDALDLVDRICEPIDLAAETVQCGDAVNDHVAAVRARAREGRAQLAVVRERAVAARSVHAGKFAQEPVGRRGRHARDRRLVEHGGRERHLVEALARPRRHRDRADDGQRVREHERSAHARQHGVQRCESGFPHVGGDGREAPGRGGATPRVARLEVVVPRRVAEIDGRSGDGRTVLIDERERGLSRTRERGKKRGGQDVDVHARSF